MKAALYLRVSTDLQDVQPQRLELMAEAQRRGWTVVGEYVDHALSGTLPPAKRPGLKALLTDAARGRFDVVASVAVDRVSRSLHDLLDVLMALQAAEVSLILTRNGFDASGPIGRAMLAVLGTFAELEASLIRSRVVAGMQRARIEGTKSGKAIGRPVIDATKADKAREALLAGASIRGAAGAAGISYGAAARLRASMQTPAPP